MEQNEIVKDYENMQLLSYKNDFDGMQAVWYDELHDMNVSGILKANYYVNGRLRQIYAKQDCHSIIVAATGLGKTTQYVIPAIFSIASQKEKKSLVISDPKGEVRKKTEGKLRAEGYRVLCYDFRDATQSECWNPLTKIYRKYQSAMGIEAEVDLVDTQDGPRNRFCGKIYSDQQRLDKDIEKMRKFILEGVGADIDQLALILVPETKCENDKIWVDGARDIIRALLWSMLEDSNEKTKNVRELVTEDTYSFATMLNIANSFTDGDEDESFDKGYFSERDKNSKAYFYAANILINAARNTRASFLSVFSTQITGLKERAAKLITCCNSFDFADLTNGPIAIFINYRDEVKSSYKLISLLIQDLYIHLIGEANKAEDVKLERPWYFILDEFGNFPQMADFETVISACRGRNIFFTLIVQSYAQLEGVYTKNTADIIKDNLNVHMFMGSNNPGTLREFSEECGRYTRFSPLSAINGNKEVINNYQLETIPLVPVSKLRQFEEGECIVTEANSKYVMFSRLERCYKCKEFARVPFDAESVKTNKVDPFDDKYDYNYPL